MYYTSYFGYIRKLDKQKYRLASITASKPSFCGNDIEDWSFIGPSLELLKAYKNKEIDEFEYTKVYVKFLNDNWDKFKDFFVTNQNNNIVLLCYEKPGDFCHRHLLSDFLNKKGIKAK